jgi:6-phosphogluconate dehydrogenase (decarboxylating)
VKIGLVGVRDPGLARRFAAAGLQVFACDAEELASDARIVLLPSAVAVSRALASPRVVWLDLADGFATELAIQDVWPECAPGDVVVDAGAGSPADARRRAASLASTIRAREPASSSTRDSSSACRRRRSSATSAAAVTTSSSSGS